MLGSASSLLDLTCRYRVFLNEPLGVALPHQPVAVEAATVLPLVGFDAELLDFEVLEKFVHGQGLLVKQVPGALGVRAGVAGSPYRRCWASGHSGQVLYCLSEANFNYTSQFRQDCSARDQLPLF